MSEVGSYVSEKINVSKLRLENYISTENMISNRGGISLATKLPSVKTTTAFQKGDILISNIRPYFKKIWLADKSGGCSNDVLVIRSDSNFSNRFLYYVLSSDRFFDYAVSTSKGTKMPRGDKSLIMKYTVPLFSLEEQELISDILKSYDEKIQLNKQINHHLEEIAQTIFDNYYLCEDNIVKKLGSLGKIQSSKRIFAKEYQSEGIPFYRGKEISLLSNNENFNPELYISNTRYNELREHNPVPKNSDILITSVGTIGNVLLVNKSHLPFYFKDGNVTWIHSIRNEIICSEYIYLWLKSEYGQQEILKSTIGSTQSALTISAIEKFNIAIPKKDNLNNFQATVAPILQSIERNSSEIQKLISFRDTLLPKLLSGEISVTQATK